MQAPHAFHRLFCEMTVSEDRGTETRTRPFQSHVSPMPLPSDDACVSCRYCMRTEVFVIGFMLAFFVLLVLSNPILW
jgi:hypothetical protein